MSEAPGEFGGEGETTDPEEPLVEVAAGAVTALTLTVAFVGLALGWPFFWVAFPVGFGGLMPLAVGGAKLYERRRERERPGPAGTGRTGGADAAGDALATLREEYARGEMDDAEFEARLQRLLETESVDDAEYWRAVREDLDDGDDGASDRGRDRPRARAPVPPGEGGDGTDRRDRDRWDPDRSSTERELERERE